MMTSLIESYAHTRMVVVGFRYDATIYSARFIPFIFLTLSFLYLGSMGANIVTKYLGEKRLDMPRNIVGGISICQGYDALG